jgi:NTP pyrophosphatase (non-canonical NTP hydrolase)
MKNVKESMYNKERCYVYNKAFARFYDNHQTQTHDRLGGNLQDAHMRTRTGALSPTGIRQEKECCKEDCDCMNPTHFDLIREWADERGLYKNGDTKTQALKLVEEVGETCRAILKEDYEEITDGIGDCVVVLINLAELHGTSIEQCIEEAYHEIKGRTGKMDNGTFKKDD